MLATLFATMVMSAWSYGGCSGTTVPYTDSPDNAYAGVTVCDRHAMAWAGDTTLGDLGD